jgi:hypothetical protein
MAVVPSPHEERVGRGGNHRLVVLPEAGICALVGFRLVFGFFFGSIPGTYSAWLRKGRPGLRVYRRRRRQQCRPPEGRPAPGGPPGWR